MNRKIVLALALTSVVSPMAFGKLALNEWFTRDSIIESKNQCLTTLVLNLEAATVGNGHVDKLKLIENKGKVNHYKVRVIWPNAKDKVRKFVVKVDSKTCLAVDQTPDDDSSED